MIPPLPSAPQPEGRLRADLAKGALAALAVTGCLLVVNWTVLPLALLAPAALFCWLIHAVFFTVGAQSVSAWLRARLDGHPWRFLIVPLLLSVLLAAYFLAAKSGPLHGLPAKPWTEWALLAAFPLAALLPVLLFLRHAASAEPKAVGAMDFLLFAMAAGIAGAYRIPHDTLPASGESFESASRLTLLLVLVYAAVVVRRLQGIGFSLDFSAKDLLFTLGCWLMMLALFVGLLAPAGLVAYAGYSDPTFRGFQSGARYFLFHLFSVGAFEELVFRGLFQNMLAQAAERLKEQTRQRLLCGAAAFFAVAAFAATFLVDRAALRWLAPMAVLLLFAGAHQIETRLRVRKGEYLVLAIISAAFGIAHFRFGAVFMTLACLAGWFDGFVYTKTKNVFLAALIHALLNCSPMFFGLHKNF